MKIIRAWIRIFAIVAMLIVQFVLSLMIKALVAPRSKQRAYQVRVTALLSRILLNVLNIRVRVENPERLPPVHRNYLIVSNHLSYTDIWVIASLIPSSFVTSIELKNSFLGPIAEAGGSLFVERRNASKLLSEIKETAKVLLSGLNVVVFPEATTSNGERLLPFRRGLLEAAMHAQADILPICLNYKLAKDKPIGLDLRDSIFYYGEMKFVDHLWRFVQVDHLEVSIRILDGLPLAERSCTRSLMQDAYARIAAAFQPIVAA